MNTRGEQLLAGRQPVNHNKEIIEAVNVSASSVQLLIAVAEKRASDLMPYCLAMRTTLHRRTDR
jgi:hypothetical protein